MKEEDYENLKNKRNNMDAYNKIAYLKIVKKQIDKEIEKLEKNLRAKERLVPLGKFVRTSTKRIVVDNNMLLKSIGKNNFINSATFTKTKLNEALDKNMISSLEKNGVITYIDGKEALKFYTDKSIQLPKINIAVSNENSNFDYQINP